MKKLGLFIWISVLMLPSVVYAQVPSYQCEVLPSCSDLGYIFSASQCEKRPKLTCPFDNTKFYCRKEATINCEIQKKFLIDGDFKGCHKDNIGDYTVMSMYGGRCGLFQEDDNDGKFLVILDKTYEAAWAEANSACESKGKKLISAEDYLAGVKYGFIKYPDAPVEYMWTSTATSYEYRLLTSDHMVPDSMPYEYVDMYNGTVELLEDSELDVTTNRYGYLCTRSEECKHGDDAPENFMEELTCKPGAYRMDPSFSAGVPKCYSELVDGSGTTYAGSGLSGSENTHLIVSFPEGDLVTSDLYVKYMDVKAENVGLVSSATQAIAFCNEKGGKLPTIDELKVLFWDLQQEGKLDILRSTLNYQASNYFVGYASDNSGIKCLPFGPVNSYITYEQMNAVMTSPGSDCASNNAVMCVFTDLFVKY